MSDNLIVQNPQFNTEELRRNDLVLIKTSLYSDKIFPKRNYWYNCLIIAVEKLKLIVAYVDEHGDFVKELIHIEDITQKNYEVVKPDIALNYITKESNYYA